MNPFLGITLSEMTEFARNVFFFSGNLFLQSTLLLATGLCLVHFIKPYGAAVQSAMLRAVLIATLLCPLASGLLGSLGMGIDLFPEQIPSKALSPLAYSEPVGMEGANPATFPPLPVSPPTSYNNWNVFYLLAFMGYITIVMALLIQIGIGYLRLRKIRSEALPATAAIQSTCIELASEMKLRAPLVLLHQGVNAPCLLGFFQPVILLQDNSTNGEALRYVLFHELSHLARHDALWNLAGRFLQACFFYQPLLHLYLRRMESLNDDVADDHVLLQGGGADYAAQLTRIAVSFNRSNVPLGSMSVMAFASSLGRRVQRILSPNQTLRLYAGRLATVAVTAVSLVLLLLTAITCVHAQNNPPATQNSQTPQAPQSAESQFIDDPAVIGKWKSVDFVKTTDQFKPGVQSWKGDLFLKTLEFMPGGRTSGPWSWSNGSLYHPGDQTTAKYTILEMKGKQYMFFEWMSGDVTLRGMKPSYYVLEYAGPSDGTRQEVFQERVLPPTSEPAFVDDQTAIGKWKSVDFVTTPEQFKPGVQSWKGDLFLKGLELMPGGRTSGPWSWSNGSLYHPGDQTTAKYSIRVMNGKQYMFFEWMSGDVTRSGKKPSYYVLEYTGPSNAPLVQGNEKVDPKQFISNTPPEFVNDPAVIGHWESVDFVSEIGDFEAGQKKWTGTLYLNWFDFLPEGGINVSVGNRIANGNNYWSNGVVWSKIDHTLSRYTIVDLNGTRYLFFEWVSGDVTLRGMKPKYYVLKAS